MTRVSHAAVALLLSLSLAGCLGGSDEDSGAPDDDVMPGQHRSHVAFLTGDMTLADDSPAPDAVPVGWSWQDWSNGRLAPAWRTEAFPADAVLTMVEAEITYRAESAVAMVAPDNRPRFTVWFGAGGEDEVVAIVDHGFEDAPPVMAAGQESTVVFPLALPVGGLAIDAGQQLVLRVATYFPDHQGAPTMSVVVGPSQLRWDEAGARHPDGDSAEATDFSGSLAGGRCVAPANPGDSAHDRHTFLVPADAVAVDVVLHRADGAGVGPDLDMFLQDADGELVTYAAGSASPERIQLRGTNLQATALGEWTLNVYNCQPQTSRYEVSVAISHQ